MILTTVLPPRTVINDCSAQLYKGSTLVKLYPASALLLVINLQYYFKIEIKNLLTLKHVHVRPSCTTTRDGTGI